MNRESEPLQDSEELSLGDIEINSALKGIAHARALAEENGIPEPTAIKMYSSILSDGLKRVRKETIAGPKSTLKQLVKTKLLRRR